MSDIENTIVSIEANDLIMDYIATLLEKGSRPGRTQDIFPLLM